MKFALSQRLALPGNPSIQAIVSARREFVTQEPEYTLRYFNEALDIIEVIFVESVVIAAQPQVVKATRIESVVTVPGVVTERELKKIKKKIKKRSRKKSRSKR